MSRTPVKVYAEQMSEADLLAAVLDLARLYGLRTAHFRPAWTEKGWRTSVAGDGRGWPDLIIVGSRLIVRELKDAHGKATAEQLVWLAALTHAGVDAGTWRPKDWADGSVRAELGALRMPAVTTTGGMG